MNVGHYCVTNHAGAVAATSKTYAPKQRGPRDLRASRLANKAGEAEGCFAALIRICGKHGLNPCRAGQYNR